VSNIVQVQVLSWAPLQLAEKSCKWVVKEETDCMSAKEVLLEVAEKLPPDATLNDAIYELEFRQAVQQGLDELDRGEGVPIEEVKAKIAEWAGK
jgi:predicted transcriptional regulator